MKKMFDILFLMFLVMSCSLLSFAGEMNEDGCYVQSCPVPEEVTHYAQEQFGKLDFGWADAMGLTDEALELRLGSGFDIELYATGESTGIYYFPVLYRGEIEKFLAVITNDGEYHTQSGYGYLAKPLNQMLLDSKNPPRIVASDDAIYAVAPDSTVTILFEEVMGNPERIKEQVQNLSRSASLHSEGLETVELTKVIGDSIHVSSSLTEIEDRATSKKLSVAFLKNKTVDNKGVCWAATAASCIDFYEDAQTDTTHAQNLMDELIEDRKNSTGSTATSISDIAVYIESYCSNLTASSTTKLTLIQTKPYIDKKYPLYTRWLNVSNNAGHAIVLCGYRTGDKDEMYLMDSNYTDEYQVCGFGENYQTPGTSKYKWSRTLTIK